MNYVNDVLNKLVDIYERRGAYKKDESGLRVIQIDIKKEYPQYVDRYNYDAYREINVAIERLLEGGFVLSKTNASGGYEKVKLNTEHISECYEALKRISVPKQCEKVLKVLIKYQERDGLILQRIVADFQRQISEYKKLPYDIKYNDKKLSDVLRVIDALLKLDKETYIRNFSTAIFKDSKRFQKEFRTIVESILFDYTDSMVEKEKILEFYNLYENPTYVYVKGDVQIEFKTSSVNVSELSGGIALSNMSLENITRVNVKTDKVITVENLTTYHDSEESEAVYIYLGGYHNRTKQSFLCKIYADNKNCSYFHQGDLDVYGFLILENLKSKTGIPFEAHMMDIATIERFLEAGIYKELTGSDKKLIKDKKNNQLSQYADVLNYMLEYNCKVEQESLRAIELVE